MGQAWEVITGRALNPGAGPTALGANTGDSFQVRSTPDNQNAQLQGIWGFAATAGLLQLRSPRMHDVVRGLRYVLSANVVRNLLPDEAFTPMFSQDPLTFEIGGGGAETDTGALLLYYPDLGGAQQRVYSWETIKPLIVDMATIEVAVTAPATAGDWSAGTAINATNDNLKGNADYAILGYTVGTLCTAVGIKGADTSNFRVGGPGPVEPIETRDWFVSLSKNTGLPAIPVVNQANRASTLVHVCINTATAVTVDLVVARLSSKLS